MKDLTAYHCIWITVCDKFNEPVHIQTLGSVFALVAEVLHHVLNASQALDVNKLRFRTPRRIPRLIPVSCNELKRIQMPFPILQRGNVLVRGHSSRFRCWCTYRHRRLHVRLNFAFSGASDTEEAISFATTTTKYFEKTQPLKQGLQSISRYEQSPTECLVVFR